MSFRFCFRFLFFVYSNQFLHFTRKWLFVFQEFLIYFMFYFCNFSSFTFFVFVFIFFHNLELSLTLNWNASLFLLQCKILFFRYCSLLAKDLRRESVSNLSGLREDLFAFKIVLQQLKSRLLAAFEAGKQSTNRTSFVSFVYSNCFRFQYSNNFSLRRKLLMGWGDWYLNNIEKL